MATKDELAANINERLEKDIEWERLTKEDLEMLDEMIESGEMLKCLTKALVKEESKDKVDQIVDDKVDEFADEYYPGKYIMEGLL